MIEESEIIYFKTAVILQLIHGEPMIHKFGNQPLGERNCFYYFKERFLAPDFFFSDQNTTNIKKTCFPPNL